MGKKKMGRGACDTSGPGILLGGGHQNNSKTGENLNLKAALCATTGSGVRIIKTEFGHFVDKAPRIAMVWDGSGSIQVGLTKIPWGWREKCGPWNYRDEHSAYLRAAWLQQELNKEGRAERDWRERNRLLRLCERMEAAR